MLFKFVLTRTRCIWCACLQLRFEVVKDGIVNANPKITTYTVKAPPLRPKQSLSCKQEVDEGQIIPELTGQEA